MVEPKFGRWTAKQISLSIEYRLDVMDEIRAAACESIRQFSSGGLDVGGVLFGTHQYDSLRILSWQPLSCEHAEGPGLCLSVDDRRDLVRLLLAAKQDPELQSLQPVGWFLSHMRDGISLSATDLEVFDGYFGEPWQVTLVLLPAPDGVARAGFFVREGGGNLRTASSYQEFIIEPTEAPKELAGESARPTLKYLRWLWAIPTLLAMILAGVLIKPQRPAPLNPGLSLRIQGEGPALQISWDVSSSTVRGSNRAEVDIQDGGHPTHLAVTGTKLRAGRMLWQRQSNNVEVQMTVYPAAGAAVRESARLLVATVMAPQSPPVDTQAEELKRVNEELRRERARSEKLQNMVKILENRLEIDTARGK